MNSFFDGYKRGTLFVLIRCDLVMYFALFFYYWILTVQSGFLGHIDGGAHAISWAFVFTFAIYARLTMGFFVNKIIGNSKQKIKANLHLLENMLIAVLIVSFAIGTNEFIWDCAFFISQAIFNGGYNIITFFEVSAVIGMGLSGTGMVVGYLLTHKKYYYAKRLFFTISVLIVFHAIWIVFLGFHYSALNNPYQNDVLINSIESFGHWGIGMGGFAFAYKRPKKN